MEPTSFADVGKVQNGVPTLLHRLSTFLPNVVRPAWRDVGTIDPLLPCPIKISEDTRTEHLLAARTQWRNSMRFALVEGVRVEPRRRLAAECIYCHLPMVAKCGQYVRWHWAHKWMIGCDPWRESETTWHLMWKDCFPQECQEVVHVDGETGERHIADVKTKGNLVVEVQHSPIAPEELMSREQFYGNMIWIVDARDQAGYFTLGTSTDLATCDPMAYHFQWSGRSKLLTKWSVSQKPVLYDIRDRPGPDLGESVTNSDHCLWRLLDYDVHEQIGFIAPVLTDLVVDAALNGRPPPRMQCDKRDAWRYRRNLVEVHR